jgi:hypothetical protein
MALGATAPARELRAGGLGRYGSIAMRRTWVRATTDPGMAMLTIRPYPPALSSRGGVRTRGVYRLN